MFISVFIKSRQGSRWCPFSDESVYACARAFDAESLTTRGRVGPLPFGVDAMEGLWRTSRL